MPPLSTSLRLAAILIASAASGAQAQPTAMFASPGVQRDMFRDGEVRRIDETVEGWRVVCDEVARVKSRVCNIVAVGQDTQGVGWAALTMTTGDNGLPAAMLKLPFGVDMKAGVRVSVKDAKGVERVTRLRLVSCAADGCMTLWPLSSAQIKALHAGRSMTVSFNVVRERAASLAMTVAPQSRPIEARIRGEGFLQAANISAGQPAAAK